MDGILTGKTPLINLVVVDVSSRSHARSRALLNNIPTQCSVVIHSTDPWGKCSLDCVPALRESLRTITVNIMTPDLKVLWVS